MQYNDNNNNNNQNVGFESGLGFYDIWLTLRGSLCSYLVERWSLKMYLVAIYHEYEYVEQLHWSKFGDCVSCFTFNTKKTKSAFWQPNDSNGGILVHSNFF